MQWQVLKKIEQRLPHNEQSLSMARSSRLKPAMRPRSKLLWQAFNKASVSDIAAALVTLSPEDTGFSIKASSRGLPVAQSRSEPWPPGFSSTVA